MKLELLLKFFRFFCIFYFVIMHMFREKIKFRITKLALKLFNYHYFFFQLYGTKFTGHTFPTRTRDLRFKIQAPLSMIDFFFFKIIFTFISVYFNRTQAIRIKNWTLTHWTIFSLLNVQIAFIKKIFLKLCWCLKDTNFFFFLHSPFFHNWIINRGWKKRKKTVRTFSFYSFFLFFYIF